MRAYTCWCASGDCDKPAPGPFLVCTECCTFGHLAAPRMGLTEDDLWPEVCRRCGLALGQHEVFYDPPEFVNPAQVEGQFSFATAGIFCPIDPRKWATPVDRSTK